MNESIDVRELNLQVAVHRAEVKARRLAEENERLRGLLTIARSGLKTAASDLRFAGVDLDARYAADSYRRSDPDVQPESGE